MLQFSFFLSVKNLIKPLILSALVLTISSCKKDSESSNIPSTNDKTVGASANDLLALNKYNQLNIQISYMPGFEPSGATISNIQSFLSGLLNKPAGINISTQSIASGNESAYSTSSLRSIENTNRTAFTDGKTIAVHVLIVDAGSTSDNENGQVLGVAYRNTSVALFGGNIEANSGGIGLPSKTTLETTVLEHEFGHILGLVNIGSPLQSNHEDGSHPGHCSETDCLMYFAVETSNFVGNLLGGNIPTLDAGCRADLKANGGK